MRTLSFLGYTFALSLLLMQSAFADITVERKRNDLIVEFKGPNGSKIPDVQKVVTDVVQEISGTRIVFNVESNLSVVGVVMTVDADGKWVTAPGGMTYSCVYRGFFTKPQIASLGHADETWLEAIRGRF